MDTMAPQSGEKQVFLYTENLLTISEDLGGLLKFIGFLRIHGFTLRTLGLALHLC